VNPHQQNVAFTRDDERPDGAAMDHVSVQFLLRLFNAGFSGER